jgi:hydroxymethylglutaryl-CoA lyase
MTAPKLPQRVRLVEVGPRDGLQNESAPVDVATRIGLIDRLTATGLPAIEAGSFVSPKWVPQMADTDQVLAGIDRRDGVDYPVLVPNMRGLESALEAGAEEIAVFGAASESFSHKNINCSVAECLERFRPVCEEALRHDVRVRGYVSCVLGCPYEGPIEPAAVASVARALADMGCYEVSLGDTVGTGTPEKARTMIAAVATELPVTMLAAHFHDTYGQALANLYAVLEQGVAVIDSSVIGLGGCPYAAGASGNVATEDVLYLLDGLGIETGVDMDALLTAGRFIGERLDREPSGRVARALARSKTA